MLGLIKDLVGLLNRLNRNTLILRLIGHLVESSYIDLPIELRGPKKGLLNIKNKDQKCFLWCHVRHINPTKEHPGKIKKVDRRLAANNLNYDGIEFPVQEKFFSKIEVQNNICINVFGYENKLVFPIYVSNKGHRDSIDLLLLFEDNNSRYVYIKDFNRFMFHKKKKRIRNGFVKVVYNALVVKRY